MNELWNMLGTYAWLIIPYCMYAVLKDSK